MHKVSRLVLYHTDTHTHKLTHSCMQGWDVVFYGDSIIERLRGTQNGG